MGFTVKEAKEIYEHIKAINKIQPVHIVLDKGATAEGLACMVALAGSTIKGGLMIHKPKYKKGKLVKE